jgi:hypothetical protein
MTPVRLRVDAPQARAPIEYCSAMRPSFRVDAFGNGDVAGGRNEGSKLGVRHLVCIDGKRVHRTSAAVRLLRRESLSPAIDNASGNCDLGP